MILRGKDEEAIDIGGSRVTLDDLFRRAGVRASDAVALIDPPNRESVTEGAPRTLTFAQADRAISALAARLCRLGLRTDTVVAMQLPNTVEAVVTLLAVLRAGMIAVPLPLLWRRPDMAAALRQVGAKAIITMSRVGAAAHVDIAMQAAAEVFPIRFVCAYGSGLPDGVVPLDDIFGCEHMEAVPPPARAVNPAAHVAAVTFEVTAKGLIAVARSHMELIAGGVAAFLESGADDNANILSTIPPASFAGIALTVLPWLLSGGSLRLHHGFDPQVFLAQRRARDQEAESSMLVLPGPVLAPLAEAGHLGAAETILALWRSPERMHAAARPIGEAGITDVASFGEIGLLAARRRADGNPAPIPRGVVTVPQGASGGATAGETMRGDSGTLCMRGPMVPVHAFPPGADDGGNARLAADEEGFVNTGFLCRHGHDSDTLVLTAPPAGLAAVGFYRFRPSEVEAQVALADPAATFVALPDGLLGERLAGSADEVLVEHLLRSGANPLIARAFTPRMQAA